MTTTKTTDQRETRAAPARVLELRVAGEFGGDGPPPTIEGYAAVFDMLSEDLGGFRERIARGAFERSIAEGDDVRALDGHDGRRILGRRSAGTLNLEEDERGLRVTITPPDTATGREVVELIRRGDLAEMSFGFMTRADAWSELDGEPIRTLLDVRLFDVSTVAFPAYPDTTVAVRSREAWRSDEDRAAPPADAGDDDQGGDEAGDGDETAAEGSVDERLASLRRRRRDPEFDPFPSS